MGVENVVFDKKTDGLMVLRAHVCISFTDVAGRVVTSLVFGSGRSWERKQFMSECSLRKFE